MCNDQQFKISPLGIVQNKATPNMVERHQPETKLDSIQVRKLQLNRPPDKVSFSAFVTASKVRGLKLREGP